MTTISAIEAKSLLAELVERFATSQLDESCEVCASMLVKAGMSHETASRKLQEMVAAGELTEHPAIWRGRKVTAYRRVDGS